MASAHQVVTGTVAQSLNVLKETVKRALALPDIVGHMVGLQPFKSLRVRVVILRDEAGEPLAEVEDVQPSLDEAQRIFNEQAHVRLLPAGQPVVIVPEPAPKAALDVHCDDGAWQEDFAAAGEYFRLHAAPAHGRRRIGYGPPVTVFVVRNISNKGGCSLGPLADYVTLEAGMLNRARHRLLAHEVAHACGLWHSKVKANLMFPRGPGAAMTRWQGAVLRGSRHVTYL